MSNLPAGLHERAECIYVHPASSGAVVQSQTRGSAGKRNAQHVDRLKGRQLQACTRCPLLELYSNDTQRAKAPIAEFSGR